MLIKTHFWDQLVVSYRTAFVTVWSMKWPPDEPWGLCQCALLISRRWSEYFQCGRSWNWPQATNDISTGQQLSLGICIYILKSHQPASAKPARERQCWVGCPRKKTLFRLCKLINWPVVLPQANNKHAKFHRDPLRFGPPGLRKLVTPLQ